MAPKRHGKANVHGSKPELPPFLQRMKEQIVSNEDKDRREFGERMRKMRPNRPDDDDIDDDPTVIKIAEEDITEEEYKRIKHDLKNNYKTENIGKDGKHEPLDLDIDSLIESRNTSSLRPSSSKDHKTRLGKNASTKIMQKKADKKTLSYSSDED